MKLLISIVISFFLLGYGKSQFQAVDSDTTSSSNLKEEPVKSLHRDWNILLMKHVAENGEVNYKSFLLDKNKLQEYLNLLAKNAPETNWSKNKKMAFYINLYNAATVQLIINHYPIKSIKDIKKPWKKRRIQLGNKKHSLGDIEHNILRKMNEPKIHFAINCASYSCPKLPNTAFTESNMELQLQEVTTDFINDTNRNIIAADKLKLSNIFKWYKKDFTKNTSLKAYIKSYSTIEFNEDAEIDFMKYNWSLNEAK